MEKTYEQIAKELQAQIDERKEADRIAEIEGAARDELSKLRYTGDNLEGAMRVLLPILAKAEDADASRAEARRLHDAVQSCGNSSKPATKRFFK